MNALPPPAVAVIEGRHTDPFSYLGLHEENGQRIVRTFLPGADRVDAIDAQGREHPLERIHRSGLFAGPVDGLPYRLRAVFGGRTAEFEDAYRFPPVLS